MLNVLGIGGVPATGKTTLMFEIIKQTDDWQTCKLSKLLDAMYSKKLNLYILGKYEIGDNAFQGTDRLSMAVQPEAEKVLSEFSYDQNVTLNIIFEGDRLFNLKFLDAAMKYSHKFGILILTATPLLIDQRHIDRNDNQDDKFKRSRQTKIDNISNSLFLMDYITYMVNNDYSDQNNVLHYIKSFFNWSD